MVQIILENHGPITKIASASETGDKQKRCLGCAPCLDYSFLSLPLVLDIHMSVL